MNLDFTPVLIVILLFIVALLFSPLGLGGGVLYVPILHYIAEWPLIESLLASLALVWMVALGSSNSHSRKGYSDATAVSAGRMTAVPAAVVGTILAWFSLEYISDVVIKVIAALILIFVIERNIRDVNIDKSDRDNLTLYSRFAACGGLASGLLGIGGGAIYVTLHRTVLGMDSRSSAGTSYLIGVVVVPVALASHILIDGTLGNVLGHTGVLPAFFILFATFSAAWLGALYAIDHLPVNIITNIFLVAVSISLVRYLWDIATYLI